MPRTCLIAAHDPWLLQLLRVYSEECGFRVVQVHEGQDVIPFIQKETPDVLLLQIDLPGQVQTGELLHLLHQQPQANQVPVVAITSQVEQVSKGMEVAAYLNEPVTYEVFIEAMKKAGICITT